MPVQSQETGAFETDRGQSGREQRVGARGRAATVPAPTIRPPRKCRKVAAGGIRRLYGPVSLCTNAKGKAWRESEAQ